MNSVKSFKSKLSKAPMTLIRESLPIFLAEDKELLFAAVESGRIEVVQLIAYHEPQNISQCLNLAQILKLNQIKQYLQQCLTTGTSEFNFIHSQLFFEAAKQGDLQFIQENLQYLQQKSYNLNKQFYNKTALMIAVENHQTKCVQYLLKEQKQRYIGGKTALMMAAERGFADICLLLKYEIKLQDNYGWNALMYAIDGKHRDCYSILKAEIKQKNEFGSSARDLAKKNDQIQILDIMC
ncbi:Ankyrin repeat-containing protein [Spironucleus salmonicida]|uniref:Ankyrin repeat-containing protein n=1 Tax=Spironucleus salmonicida TaxID=348837 RepID=V6LHJ2_9EUKA|nr:Ankyrin repeat-containing protein [Spironucleus salmonicida]|eukprot:EST44040.1 Ankyrin repeat-containing protein [Spironucleus salmonicida]